MTKLNVLAIAAIAVFPAIAQTQPLECEGMTLNVKAVTLAVPRTGPMLNFTGSGGLLDPTPLLQTDINVVGSSVHPACVTVTFSSQADPTDNYAVYQASIDNVPMSGHGTLQPEQGLTTPIVFDAVNQGFALATGPGNILNAANSRMVSYTFFASVLPGMHTIRIRLAGCCSPALSGASIFVRAATLVARY